MLKRSISLAILVLVSLSLTGCLDINLTSANTVIGSGKVASETRNVSGYDQIVLTGSGYATITVGDGEGMSIEAEDNILPLIETTVQNGKLVIGLKPNTSIRTTRGLSYTISAISLNGIEITGSGSASLSPVKSEQFQALISGSGSIKLAELRSKSLKVMLTGSGSLDVNAGKVESQDVMVSGSGSYDGGRLECGSAQVGITGSGSAAVWVTGSLNAQTSGSGSVRYYGQPNVSKSETGSGRVSSLGIK